MAKKRVKKSEHKGGWPKRDYSKFVLRVDPMVAEVWAFAASTAGVSRNELLEYFLRAFGVMFMSPDKERVAEVIGEISAIGSAAPLEFNGGKIDATRAWEFLKGMTRANAAIARRERGDA